jgi:ADP-heptose:LPS heptosyltransferase/glycosyltransferase involved in cell wall biosynthesis
VVASEEGWFTGKLKELKIPFEIVPMGKGKLRYIWRSIPAMMRLRKFLQQWKIQIIHANTFEASKFALLGSFVLRIPLFLHQRIVIQKSPFSQFAIEFKVLSQWMRRVICVSDAVKKSLLKIGISQERLVTIRTGLDLEPFHHSNKTYTKESMGIDSDGPVVGTIGIIRPEKKLEVFIHAAKNVLQSYPSARFFIAGDVVSEADQKYKEKLLSLVEELELSEQILWSGLWEDVPSLLPVFDIFISTSPVEALGRSIVEAMATGLPIVAVNGGGIPEVIEDGEEGLLIPPGEPDSLSRTIIELLKDHDNAKQLGAKARERVLSSFGMEEYVSKISLLLSSAVDNLSFKSPFPERSRMDIRKILIIKLRGIGDTILATPLISEIRKNFPKSNVTALVRRSSEKILHKNPDVDEILLYEEKLIGYIKLVRKLQRMKIDLALCPHASFRSALLSYLSRSKERVVNNFSGPNYFATVKRPISKIPKSAIERDLDCLRSLEIEPHERNTRMYFGEEDKEKVSHLFRRGKLSVGFSIGASREEKKWNLENFARVIDGLKEKDVQMILFSSSNDERESDSLFRMVSSSFNSYKPKSIQELAAGLARCDLYIGNDSGPLHVAVAVGTPTIALFGPENPVEWHPYPDAEKHIVLRKGGEINRILPEEVLQKALEFLKTR